MFFLKPKQKPLHNKPSYTVYNKPSIAMLPVQSKAVQEDTDTFQHELSAVLNLLTECRIVSIDSNARTTVYHIDCKDVFQFPKIKKNLIAIQAALHTPISLITSDKAHFALETVNNKPKTVNFRDCLAVNPNGLTATIGTGTESKAVFIDIEKAPHLLIAGQTGSGKSVLENTIIASLLMNYNPSQLQLMLIDPKCVELSQYSGIPHLLSPIITDAQKAAIGLNYCVSVMEERYRTMEKRGLQNGKDIYSAIVIVIDELADLMLSGYRKPIETAITRLAQLGRAANIHLIIATQRPTVNVITGLIKANIPARIALNVASVRDSMVILDHKGAERLQGNGDGLYKQAGSITETRIQAAYIDKQTIQTIVNHWKRQA